ncbi:chorismate-binding protein [Thiorhodospira sibirica]|uniref:chorismate-binding protein n=1 Tax=Thiorhodospira sibirica TaxID=154347 RepID=UPI00022C0AF3|nr:chorismate-binding protein [Thiorhodospira sibirica]
MISQARHLAILRDPEQQQWLVFRNPCRVMVATRLDEVVPMLALIEAEVAAHHWYAAGFLAYEAAPAFDAALSVRADGAFPLLWFALFAQCERFSHLPPAMTPMPVLSWEPSVGATDYAAAIERIKAHLRAGDSYQVNYSFRLQSPFAGDAWSFFQSYGGAVPPPYAAYLHSDDWALCCFSPELFFRLDGEIVISRPMKGTRPRGLSLAQDQQCAAQLSAASKDRAENLMITDMVRNDLGRIAKTGTVRTEALFALEKHATVWQMTSTVKAHTDASIAQIIAHLFPAASITGAPKAASMQIIAHTETAPRRIYTGSIGWFGPGRQACFNVAIRTVLLDKVRHRAEYGTGGGIVWDSRAEEEFAECFAKARVLRQAMPTFELLETLLWTPQQGYFLLDEHLNRLCESARYFDFGADIAMIQAKLVRLAERFGQQPRRVRLLLKRNGDMTVTATHAPSPFRTPPAIRLAAQAVHSQDVFLYHKTTHRQAYAQALASRPGDEDVLLFNERDEVTESTRANIALRMGQRLYTPPQHCGLLAGTLRAYLLKRGLLCERVLTRQQVQQAEAIYLLNSLRGLYAVRLLR